MYIYIYRQIYIYMYTSACVLYVQMRDEYSVVKESSWHYGIKESFPATRVMMHEVHALQAGRMWWTGISR